MLPSRSIIQESLKSSTVSDKKGRKIVVRTLTALDTLRLFKAAGPVLSQNQAWLSMAMLAFTVTEIDGVPVPPPLTEPQIESLIDRLGDDGLAAVADNINASNDQELSTDQMGNLPSTQF